MPREWSESWRPLAIEEVALVELGGWVASGCCETPSVARKRERGEPADDGLGEHVFRMVSVGAGKKDGNSEGVYVGREAGGRARGVVAAVGEADEGVAGGKKDVRVHGGILARRCGCHLQPLEIVRQLHGEIDVSSHDRIGLLAIDDADVRLDYGIDDQRRIVFINVVSTSVGSNAFPIGGGADKLPVAFLPSGYVLRIRKGRMFRDQIDYRDGWRESCSPHDLDGFR